MIDIKEDKDKIAIIVVGYNKLFGLKRLLQSLSDAVYPISEVPLIISIDASKNEAVYNYAKDFEWIHGEKYVNIEAERLGLKKHIFQCASYTKYYKGVILLEDDIFVSPYFYSYGMKTIEKYGNDERISGIALYESETNGYVGIPFQPVNSGCDVYAFQTVCSWGQIWNARMWDEFSSWMEIWDGNFDKIDMIPRIKEWTRAWSKYYYAYMILNNKYFIYPYIALSTNFNDAGGEHGGGDTSVQVSLLQGNKEYRLFNFEQLVKYDVYGNNLEIYKWLGLKEDELTIDFYGLKEKYQRRYILAPFKFAYKRIRGFSLTMRPWELNVKYEIEGNDLILYDRGSIREEIPPRRKVIQSVALYHFRNYNVQLMLRNIVHRLYVYIINKCHL